MTAASALAGCTVERAHGEFGIGLCTDRADNDDDGVADCRDPDCQAEDVCGRAAPLREPDASMPRPPISGSPAPLPALDAGVVAPPEPITTDAELGEPLPAPQDPDDPPEEPEPVLECTTPCTADESCIKGYCVPNEAVFVEVWDVVSVSVKMPRAGANGACLDPYVCIGLGSQLFETCSCPPDPRVKVSVKRPGEEPMLAFDTDAALQTDEHEWKVSHQLLLRREFEIVLAAFDQDGRILQPVFTCSVLAEPELLGSGTVSCTQSFDGTGAFGSKKFEARISLGVQPASATDPPGG